MSTRKSGKTNNVRRYTGGGPRPDLREKRQAEAAARQAERDELSPRGQLKRLDDLLGKDIGAKKERARLQAKLERLPAAGKVR